MTATFSPGVRVDLRKGAFVAGLQKFIFLLVVYSCSFGHHAFAGCFTTHVKEAMDLNHERLGPYVLAFESAEHQRMSLDVSRQLISMEELLVPFAKYLDHRAKPYRKAGMDFMCREFIDIAETPDFDGGNGKSLENPISTKTKVGGHRYKKNIKAFARAHNYAGIVEVTVARIEDLKQRFPKHFCLHRHFLESIARIAALAPGNIETAKSLGLPSPAKHINFLLTIHRIGLKTGERIDRDAIALQNAGVPIVCNDLPHIPLSDL